VLKCRNAICYAPHVIIPVDETHSFTEIWLNTLPTHTEQWELHQRTFSCKVRRVTGTSKAVMNGILIGKEL